MGTFEKMARRRLLVWGMLIGGLAGTATTAQAAYYDSGYFYLTGGFSFDTVSPDVLNQATDPSTKLQTILGGRLRVERGLRAPNLTHWLEFGYHAGSSAGLNEGATYTVDKSLRYMSLVPLGVTYWFNRTSFIDFGASLGVGLGLAPSLTVTTTQVGGTAVAAKGNIAPIIDGKFEARFWMSRYLGVTATGSLRYYSPTFADVGGASVKANLLAYSIGAGLTYSFGGVKGTGRTMVEVIPADRSASETPETKAAEEAPPRRTAPPLGKKPTPPPAKR